MERAKGIGSKREFPEGVGAEPPPVPTRILTSFLTRKFCDGRCMAARNARAKNGETGWRAERPLRSAPHETLDAHALARSP